MEQRWTNYNLHSLDEVTPTKLEYLYQIQQILPEKAETSRNIWRDAQRIDITDSDVSFVAGSEYNFTRLTGGHHLESSPLLSRI
jgi:hypothetical protein